MKMTLKSGATLEITRSPFVIGHKLFKTVLKEFKSVNLKIGLKEGTSVANMFSDLEVTDEMLNTVKDAFATILSSQDIEDCLWECMPRVLYNGKKIDKTTFDDETACGDFIEIFKEVMLANLAPFRKSLESLFPNVRLSKSTAVQT